MPRWWQKQCAHRISFTFSYTAVHIHRGMYDCSWLYQNGIQKSIEIYFEGKRFHENGLGQQSVPQTANRVTHLTSLAVDIHYNKTFWKLTRTIVYLRWMEKVARPQKFNFWRQKRAVSEQFFVICGQTSWSNPLKKFLYLLWTSAGLAFQS